MKTGLYIHIPFCKQKCNYCDFASFAGRENLIGAYLAALAQEAALFAKTPCQTLYVGGGTPSVLSPAQIDTLCNVVEPFFGPISHFEESTFEANPESLTPAKVSVLQARGFKRLSMGLQSFDEEDLKRLGRIHTVEQFLTAFENAQKGGFHNINVDLMAGLPTQTFESFSGGLEKLAALAPTHISVYGLQIEEGTVFFERGIVCDQLLMRRMLEFAHDFLTEQGYIHYEISNFAKPCFQARHNTHYWHNGDYIGLGSAAASYQNGVRRQNTAQPQDYIACVTNGKSPVVFSEKLSGLEKEGETLMLAFRQLGGVELTDTQQQLFGRAIQKHLNSGLLVRDGKKVKLSREGLFLANEVFYSFVPPFDEP